MNVCDRFENEGLEHFVAGEPPDAHLESCPDCRTARASYQALASALAKAGEAEVPDGAWEAKVWARIQQQGVRRRPWAILIGLGAAAAALALFFVNSAGGPEVLAFATVQVERGPGAPVRGGTARPGEAQSAAPGDMLHLVAKVPRGKVADLRVYRGADELVFQCATTTACIRTRDTLEARVKLDRAGTYRSVALAADKQLPEATGNLDADTAAGMRAGSASESPPVEVL
jgi:hypothetical protein